MNIDPRSALLNTEIGVVFDSRELGADFIETLTKADAGGAWELKLQEGDLVWLDCSLECKVVSHNDLQSSLFTRISVLLFSLLPIEGQL